MHMDAKYTSRERPIAGGSRGPTAGAVGTATLAVPAARKEPPVVGLHCRRFLSRTTGSGPSLPAVIVRNRWQWVISAGGS